jgi:predicted PurR-regulated permease PerM
MSFPALETTEEKREAPVSEPAVEALAASSPRVFSQEEERVARRADGFWALGMLGILVLIFASLTYIKVVAIPLLFAFALAYALNPLVVCMCRARFSRLLSVMVVFAGLLGLLLGFIFYLIPVLKAQYSKVPEFFSRSRGVIVAWVEKFKPSIPESLYNALTSVGEEVGSFLNELWPALAQLAGSLASSTPGIINVLIGIGLVPVLSIVFLLRWEFLRQKLVLWIPEWSRVQIAKRSGELNEVLSGFIRGQLLVGCILTVCYATGFWISGIDMALLIALVAGFGNIVPYVGTASGIALAGIALLLSSGTGWGQVLGVTATFIVTQILEGVLITPKIVGDRVGLPAIIVIIAVLTFGELFGFIGILLSLPVTAVLKVILRVIFLRYREISWYAKG